MLLKMMVQACVYSSAMSRQWSSCSSSFGFLHIKELSPQLHLAFNGLAISEVLKRLNIKWHMEIPALFVKISGLCLKSARFFVKVEFGILNSMGIFLVTIINMTDLVLPPSFVHRHCMNISTLSLAESIACATIKVHA